MDLAEIMALRPVPAAGLLVTLTSRCPLHCAHCSTASTRSGPQPTDGDLRRFITTMGDGEPPRVVFLTGGEPLLRPRLLAGLASAARAAGAATAVLTGGFFARDGRIPGRVLDALLALDHVSFSLDVFHEREVPRPAVLAALRTLLDRGQRVSLHVVGAGPDDPYLAEVTAQVRRTFGRAVPMLITRFAPAGRAAAWLRAVVPGAGPSPCSLAAWPVVAADGVITACCNPATVDRRPVPAHLDLGHVADADWPRVRARLLASGVLRAVRTLGPAATGEMVGSAGEGDACTVCRGLRAAPGPLDGPAGELLDRLTAERARAAGPVALVRRYGIPEYAHEVAS